MNLGLQSNKKKMSIKNDSISGTITKPNFRPTIKASDYYDYFFKTI